MSGSSSGIRFGLNINDALGCSFHAGILGGMTKHFFHGFLVGSSIP